MGPWHQGLDKQNCSVHLGEYEVLNLQDSIKLNEFVSATYICCISFLYFVLYPAVCMNVWHVSF